MTVTNSKNIEFCDDIHEETVFLGPFYFITDSGGMTGNEAEWDARRTLGWTLTVVQGDIQRWNVHVQAKQSKQNTVNAIISGI